LSPTFRAAQEPVGDEVEHHHRGPIREGAKLGGELEEKCSATLVVVHALQPRQKLGKHPIR